MHTQYGIKTVHDTDFHINDKIIIDGTNITKKTYEQVCSKMLISEKETLSCKSTSQHLSMTSYTSWGQEAEGCVGNWRCSLLKELWTTS